FPSVSNHKALKWLPDQNKEGNLVTSFFWPESGTYEVTMHIVQSPDGGNFEVGLNGNDMETASFTSSSEGQSTKRILIGKTALEAGRQELTFRWQNNHPKRNHLQVDYVKFTPVP